MDPDKCKGEGDAATDEGVLSEVRETSGIGLAGAGGFKDAVVAGKLTLDGETPLQPEQDGVEGKDDEGDAAKEIGPVVTTAEVFEFVQQYLLKFGRTESFDEANRQQDARVDKAENAGTVDFCGGAELDGTRLGAAACGEQGGTTFGNRDGRCGTGKAAERQGSGCELDGADERGDSPNSGDKESPARVYI